MEQSKLGPTVAAGLLASLAFLQRHLCIQIAVDDALVAPFHQKNTPHLARQREVISLQAWIHLTTLAKSGKSIGTATRMLLRYTLSVMWFEHTKRAKLLVSLSSQRD